MLKNHNIIKFRLWGWKLNMSAYEGADLFPDPDPKRLVNFPKIIYNKLMMTRIAKLNKLSTCLFHFIFLECNNLCIVLLT